MGFLPDNRQLVYQQQDNGLIPQVASKIPKYQTVFSISADIPNKTNLIIM